MIVIDKLCYSSRLRKMNPEEKFWYAVATLLLCVLHRSVLLAGIVFTVNGYLNIKKGGIRPGRYFRLMLVPLGFLLLSTAAILVNVSETPLDAYAIPLGTFYLTGSRESLVYGGQLILTALAAVSCLYFLSLNTPVTEILGVLKRLRCPAVLIELMMLTYRFIFVLMETASSILTSQKARLGNRGIKTSIRSFGLMASMLFIRSMKKSSALYDAMESRCYDGKIRVLREGEKAKKNELIWIICYECALLVIIILESWTAG